MSLTLPTGTAREFTLLAADWDRDRAAIQGVRRAVFVEEQAIPENLEWDGRDATCRHVLARARDGAAIATGRLQQDGRIGRMAVLRAWRGHGVGRAVLQWLQLQAMHDGLQRVYVHAQVQVAGFYTGMGFRPQGEPFELAEILHQCMVKRLDPG